MDEVFPGRRELLQSGGILTTSNFIPDAETGIGNWTEEILLACFKTFAELSFIPHCVNNNKELIP